jgi:hypothetical protein
MKAMLQGVKYMHAVDKWPMFAIREGGVYRDV